MNFLSIGNSLPCAGKAPRANTDSTIGPTPSVHQQDAKSLEVTLQKPFSSLEQAKALKVLTFAGTRFQASPAIKLEAKFIELLGNSRNSEEKAAVAEILGRAQSLNAIPTIVRQLDKKEALPVRIAAIKALGTIGASTNENSFTRRQLGQVLLDLYEVRRREVAAKASPQSPIPPQALSGASEEMQALAEALGKLGFKPGKAALLKDFKETLALTERYNHQAQTMIHAIEIAEKVLAQQLEEQFDKPFETIKNELNPLALSQLQAQTQISLPGGSRLSILEASAVVHDLQDRQRFNAGLLLGQMSGLVHNPDRQSINALKAGLESSDPMIKSGSLWMLGGTGMLNYASDIRPNLNNRNREVRLAALESLFYANEEAATQKLLEFLSPKNYLKLAVDGQDPLLTLEALGQFVDFTAQLAENGDKYVHSLKKIAVNRDYELANRQMALTVLSMMTQEPLKESLLESTVKEAASTIKEMALRPSGNDRREKDAIALSSTRFWLALKDPQAVKIALHRIDEGAPFISQKTQETLLSSIAASLRQGFEETSLSNRQRHDGLLHMVSDMLETSGDFKASDVARLRKQLRPALADRLVDSSQAGAEIPETPDQRYIHEVRGMLGTIRPSLHQQLEHKSSLKSRILAADLLGLLRDRNSVDQLIEKTRDPLKGLVDWNKDVSYPGSPAAAGVSFRRSSLLALGRIGDAKAVDVMLDALDDPALRAATLQPLARLAPDANDKLSQETLRKLHTKLTGVLADPSTARAIRGQRIEAGNTLFQYPGGVEAIKDYLAQNNAPNFKRHVLSVLIRNQYALDPKHADHDLVKGLIHPGLGVERLHKAGVTGKGVEMAIIDGGYVDQGNKEAFQDRVKLPVQARDPEHYHPTMVMSTAAGNGKLKGVAPQAMVYSDKWPELGGNTPMEVYKKLIEGKLRGEHNIRVINNSWGMTTNNVIIHKQVRDLLKEFKQVVDLAEQAGMVFVFSAGNDGEGLGIPGIGTLSLFGLDIDKLTAPEREDLNYILDKVVLVGATNTQGFDEDYKKHRLGEFSSIGDSLKPKLAPTVLAPGVDMMVYSYDNGQRPMELVNGTSFSGPYVSGLVALLFQKNPNLTPAQVRSILTSTAVKLPNLPETYQGAGEVEPHAAVAAAEALARKSRVASRATKAPTPIRPPGNPTDGTTSA